MLDWINRILLVTLSGIFVMEYNDIHLSTKEFHNDGIFQKLHSVASIWNTSCRRYRIFIPPMFYIWIGLETVNLDLTYKTK